MKFRKDFVTNSSSSSFICDVCGRDESGFDLSLADAGMMECVNGHVFCCDEALEHPSKEEMIKIILENAWNEKYNWRTGEDEIITEGELIEMDEEDLFDNFYLREGYYDVPECICPICQFEEYSSNDMLKYLLKEYKLKPTEVMKSWKERFGTYKKFNDWIRQEK